MNSGLILGEEQFNPLNGGLEARGTDSTRYANPGRLGYCGP